MDESIFHAAWRWFQINCEKALKQRFTTKRRLNVLKPTPAFYKYN